jgi:UDP-N-acetylmuramoyl-L-alanyl-D-glutamate--2,6-diaminopimelate ligase
VSVVQVILDRLGAFGVSATRLTLDSRRVMPGDIFLALPGAQVDGRAYIPDAVARGAAAVLAEADGKVGAGEAANLKAAGAVGATGATGDVPIMMVEHLGALAGEIAHLVYGRPSEQLWLCGVTGTNGKTSVSQWIAQAMDVFGCPCGVVGTLGSGFLSRSADGQVDFSALDASVNTTPDAVSLHAALARFVREGAVACAMEVSSIGLDQGRTNGAQFDVAVFTNLTRDHLEYHGSMEAYGAAKAKLFDLPGLGAAVLNLDDPHGAALAARLKGRLPTIGYTLDDAVGADRVLRAVNLRQGGAGIGFDLDGITMTAPLVGRFNAANLLAVVGALLAADESLDDIAAVLPGLAPPPGRMQVLGGRDMPLVVVDYAHTPDALEKVLMTLRETAAARGGRLVCVFGCGGDRDPGKRPMMGAMAERLADRAVVTSDNPRSEDPQAIITAILAGMQKAPAVEADRATAIRTAIGTADARDVILLAGKGHEPYQEIAGVRLPFSDRDAARAALVAEWSLSC